MNFIFSLLFSLLCICPQALASVTVTVNGSNYQIPQNNEKGWGTAVTTWIQQVSSYTLQPTGGTFTLTADVNFGSSYGLKGPYLTSSTTNPATAGVLRLAKTDVVDWRNNANGANLALGIDGSDNLTFNSVIIPTATSGSFQDSTFFIYDNADTSKKIQFEASGITTATTRTYTMPDANVTLVGRTGSLTNHGVILGAATNGVGSTSAGSTGQLLVSQGASSDPVWTTPAYPTASATAGKIIRSNGTDFVSTTATFPDTAVQGSILNASASNVVGSTVTPVLGLAGTSTGTIGLSGVTSGVVTIQPQSAAGTYNFNLPITAGSSGQVLTSAAGGSSPMTWSSVLTNPATAAYDVLYQNTGNTALTNLSPNTTTTKKYLSMTGTGAAGAAPTWSWTAPTISVVTASSHSGGFSANSSGTYTPPAGSVYWIFHAVGGGAGGGGASNTSAAAGGGGGAGSYALKMLTTSPGATTYAVGAAGAAGNTSGTSGGVGGDTTLSGTGLTITAGGGAAGTGSTGNMKIGGAGGTATGGDFNASGGYGASGTQDGVSGQGGSGGASIFGSGGPGGSAGLVTAGAGTAYGSGGGAGGARSAASAGAAGVAGIIWVEEFYQ